MDSLAVFLTYKTTYQKFDRPAIASGIMLVEAAACESANSAAPTPSVTVADSPRSPKRPRRGARTPQPRLGAVLPAIAPARSPANRGRTGCGHRTSAAARSQG